MKRIAPVVAGVLLLMLSACSFSANLTVSPESLAANVAGALEQNGMRPNIDCGENSIDLKVGNVVHCELSATGDPTVFDVAVTITKVDGMNYTYDVKVADTPS